METNADRGGGVVSTKWKSFTEKLFLSYFVLIVFFVNRETACTSSFTFEWRILHGFFLCRDVFCFELSVYFKYLLSIV